MGVISFRFLGSEKKAQTSLRGAGMNCSLSRTCTMPLRVWS